uniref:Uncharacterized protein n=1 Tax=Hyaloperonospora arabidopsidis (strain Emoy2) TaxID=559515 RepID=M4C3E9_HYAAE
MDCGERGEVGHTYKVVHLQVCGGPLLSVAISLPLLYQLLHMEMIAEPPVSTTTTEMKRSNWRTRDSVSFSGFLVTLKRMRGLRQS